MSAGACPPVAAVPGLTRSDPHGPGITRERIGGGFRYRDLSGAEVTSPEVGGRRWPGSDGSSGGRRGNHF